MSSTVSTTEMKTIPTRPIVRLKADEHKSKLVRTSSIEKIRRFNSYICAQHYYVVPALLTWLKSSHSCLQSSAEKTILFFRSLIFNAFFYRVIQNVFRVKAGVVEKMDPDALKENLISNFYDYFSGSFESTLLSMGVYFVSVLVYSQLLISIYFLSLVPIPGGLYFLLLTGVYISFLCYKSIFFYKNKIN